MAAENKVFLNNSRTHEHIFKIPTAYVWGSDKSNEMSEKIKIELALVYYCPVHDQSDIFSILPIDKLVDFL